MCRLYSTWAQLRSTCLVVVCGISVPQPETEPRLLELGVQSLNHWTAREVPGIHFYLLLGMKAECPAQKEQQRQETPDFQEREGHQGQRDVAPRPRGRPFSKHKWTPHTVSICTYILGNSSFDHTSHINLGKTTYKPWDGLDQKPPWKLLLPLNYPAVTGILWRRVWQKVKKINK